MRRKMTRRDRNYRDGLIHRHERKHKRAALRERKETEAERRKREAEERQYLIRVVLKPHWIAEEHIFSLQTAEFLPVQGCTCATCERVRRWNPKDVVNPFQPQLDKLNAWRRRVREEMEGIMEHQPRSAFRLDELVEAGPTEVAPAMRSVYWRVFLREFYGDPQPREVGK